MAMSTITSIWNSSRSRWSRSEEWNRLAHEVVANQIHHAAAKLATIQVTPDCGRAVSTAAEKISIAAT